MKAISLALLLAGMTQIASAGNVANPIGMAPSLPMSAGPVGLDLTIYEAMGVDYLRIGEQTWTSRTDPDVTYRF